jgi:NADH-ubiquinone oxidoreductase chain 5
MAAPTPISSLVHSSTLVTAGVFLVVRFSRLFLNNYFIKRIILTRGIITIILASIIALWEKDLKKVVALSTLRHLGLMITSCSLVGPIFGFFHLIMHAIFKALLFINIGYLILSRGHNQDRRLLRLNSNYLTMSVVFTLFSMVGFYFFNGFFSKDLIIFFRISIRIKNLIVAVLMFVRFCLTVSYSIRFFLRLFSFFKNIQISLRKTLFKRTVLLILLCLFAGKIVKILALENYMFLYADKISFFIPLMVLITGFGIHKIVSNIKTIRRVESIFYLNFVLGN